MSKNYHLCLEVWKFGMWLLPTEVHPKSLLPDFRRNIQSRLPASIAPASKSNEIRLHPLIDAWLWNVVWHHHHRWSTWHQGMSMVNNVCFQGASLLSKQMRECMSATNKHEHCFFPYAYASTKQSERVEWHVTRTLGKNKDEKLNFMNRLTVWSILSSFWSEALINNQMHISLFEQDFLCCLRSLISDSWWD